MLVEFVGVADSKWPSGWQVPESALPVVASAALLQDQNYLALGDAAPRLCLRSHEIVVANATKIAYLAASPSTLSQFSPSVRGALPMLALDFDEPIEQAYALNHGAVAWSGWSCMKWKRRSADKKVGLLSTILKLIQLIDKDADSATIETLFKRDAVLSYQLASMANSAAYGLAVEITSINHAMNILGREKLKRWLSLSLLHAGGGDTPQVLLNTAYARASFLETIGKSLDFNGAKEDLFLCGAFSLLDRILGIPLADLLSRISISDTITDALIGDTGSFAPLIELMRAVEMQDDLAVRTQCEMLSLNLMTVNQALLAALPVNPSCRLQSIFPPMHFRHQSLYKRWRTSPARSTLSLNCSNLRSPRPY